MISLFIFKSNTRGMRYGIGTYINQLIGSLSIYPDIKIILVNFRSDKYKEFTLSNNLEQFTEIHIPSPIISSYSGFKNDKYSEKVVDLLTPFINKSDNIVFQINYLDALPLARTLKSRYKFPVLSIIHSAQWQFMFDGNKQNFKEIWSDREYSQRPDLKPIMQEKELYELSDLVVSVTDYMKEFIIRYYGLNEHKIKVIHNGIDNTLFHIPDKKERLELKKRLGFSIREKIILFSGRLDSSKGIYFLLEAFSEVVKRNDNTRLVLVGDDSGPDKIPQYLSHCSNMWGKVTFTGFIEYEHMLKFYQIADIGVIPSVYDHGTYVALEMIGHNIPLIVSDADGFEEFLTHDQCIFITQVVDDEGNIKFDKKDFAEAILSLLFDRKKAGRIISEYNKMIMNKLSSKRMASEYYSLLKDFGVMAKRSVTSINNVPEYSRP